MLNFAEYGTTFAILPYVLMDWGVVAMSRISRKEQDELVDQLGSMSVNRFLKTVMDASEQRGVKLDRFVADTVAKDIQAHLTANAIETPCPECHGTHVKKFGKRGVIQRYRCLGCGRTFTALTGTILEKTNYTWDVWVEVIHGMLNGIGIEKTRQTLADDYCCSKIDKTTVWLMRMKVMYAVAGIPSPTLTGVIQFDDTFLKEDQKASRHLVNPLPDKVKPTRPPRYGRVPSSLGIRGNEFATITTAIDSTKHCVCRVLACGAVPEGVLYDFVNDHTDGIAFACSDGDGTYKRVFGSMNVAHYLRPSDYSDITKKAGYVPAHGDEGQRRSNRYILERLWSEGAIDRILNRGKMTYERFEKLKGDNALSLGRVNELHNEMKAQLERATRGVSTKYLPYYLAWFEYTHNRGVDLGHPLTSRRDAEAILVEAIKTRRNITVSEIERIRREPLAIPQASGRYIHLLERNTAKMRVELDDPKFLFGDEDDVSSFDVRKIVWALSDAKMRDLARRLGVKGWGSRKRSALARDILKCPNIDDHLLIVAVDGNSRPTSAVYDDEGSKRYQYRTNRPVLPSMFTPLFCSLPEAASMERVVFVDTETTGVDPAYDEVIQLAIISLDGEVLYGDYLCPRKRRSWKSAEKVNHISPAMVAGKPTLSDERGKVEAALAGAVVIVGWNLGFDLRMLYANGVDVPMERGKYCDLMPAFCEAWRKAGHAKYRRKTEKLVNATAWLNVEHDAHDAIGDTKVLIPIWEWVESVIGATNTE